MTAKKAGDHAINRESLYGTTSEPTYAGVSSTQIRELARQGGDLGQLCPPSVEQRIARRLGRSQQA